MVKQLMMTIQLAGDLVGRSKSKTVSCDVTRRPTQGERLLIFPSNFDVRYGYDICAINEHGHSERIGWVPWGGEVTKETW